ncbi:hydrolase [Hymenobacter sp. DH14]|uniref:Hydrolase n=1 Tax=Hymenobacter cyanobacteriorum TaxID=2926463 RepID=A0A9X1VF53_9BACT|nr:hydrolase [Hymenobacter cyanobacteriorum]MCI1188044.1 hydrolase [Hymenobacter cyanobacteriorum]
MNFTARYLVAPLLGAAALFASCSKSELTPAAAPTAAVVSQNVSAPGFPEGFETGTKTAYTTGSVTLGSGSWTLNDALIGNTTADAKTGSWSARVRNSGSLSMNFDLTGGAGVVTVAHAKYGTDAASTWELWASANSGSSYAKVGSTITSSSTSLSTASFTVNIAGNVRLQVRKTDGSTNRINIDNITVESYSSGGGGGTGTGGKKFLFDATHAETAGNADWVLDVDGGVVPRYPTPAASGITASTSETYWAGAVSAWGVALVKLGNTVENLPVGTAITYGNTSNPQDLANYSVFVVDEPNTLFSASEKTAIINFVKNGGGLFMISDHDVSDRNNDGYDSPAIWNDLMTNNSVQANPFGYSINLTNISETSSNVLASSTNVILNGSQGAVTQLKFSNGATMTKTSGSAATPLIWQSTAAQGNSNIMCLSSTYGTGRVVCVTDSSPADDGTGSPGNTVYPGWTEIASHAKLHLNASLWLAKLQ